MEQPPYVMFAMNLNIKNGGLGCIYAFMLMVTISCQKEDQTLTVLNVNTGLTVELGQELSDEGGQPLLKVTTSDPQECSNVQFMTSSSIIGNQAELMLAGLTLNGEACQIGNTQVSTSLLLSKKYAYMNFIISLSTDARFPGSVKIENQKAKLEMNNQKGIISKNNEINLIESGVLWGSIALSSASADSSYLFAAQKLLKTNCKKDFQPNVGDFGFFTYNQQGEITLDVKGLIGKPYNFFIKLDPANMRELITGLQKIPQLNANIYTYNGKIYKW